MVIEGTPYGEAISVATGATGTWDFSSNPGTILSICAVPEGSPSAQTFLYRMTVDGSNPSASVSSGIEAGLVLGGGIDTDPHFLQFAEPIETVKILNEGNAGCTYCVTVYTDAARG